ncbi:MAG: phosphoribosylformimino-5-aminoimidazole carboxamide ribotide isomerase [Verrucomicrobia bacterium]|nr:MAG: phosphoribosylformimino-5-aminoimidazole carboxamide ribotide isomerase [Verrucomicrobiota bacterium]
MTRFRPCIDLHQGIVKQIVGGSLRDDGTNPQENFVARNDSAWFAERFRDDELTGGHVIQLGPGNTEAARRALAAWPGGLQIGGGIHHQNAQSWLDAGASHVIVTSSLFDQHGLFLPYQLELLVEKIGTEKLVIDLSCRRTSHGWAVTMNRWQTLTSLEISMETFERFAPFCAEFLIHAADVEGLCSGIDRELIAELSQWHGKPITYAGGATSMEDLWWIQEASGGRIDVTVGSALDLFGGTGFSYQSLVAWNQRSSPHHHG